MVGGLAAILAIGVGVSVWQDVATIYIIAGIAAAPSASYTDPARRRRI